MTREKKKMKKSLESIDLAKFVASILIFSMHCDLLSDYKFASIIPQLLARWGVPFFFICSSYFLFRKSVGLLNIDDDVIRKYILRIFLLYTVWFIYNIPNFVYMRLYQQDILSIITWLILFKNSILSSTFTASWYLSSSIFSAWLIFALSKKFHTKDLIMITFIPYLICVTTSVYKGILPYSLRNIFDFLCFPLNIFNGCFYFSIGKYIAENEKQIINKINKKQALMGFAIFHLLFFAEIFISKYFKINGETDVGFFTIFISASLFLFCLQTNIKVKNSLLLRKLSTIIYCSQANVLLVNGFLKQILHISSILSFIASALIMVMICITVIYIQNKLAWKWTKYLT